MKTPLIPHKRQLPELAHDWAMPLREPPLISCYGYSGGYRWHWRQPYDSRPGPPVVIVHGAFLSSLSLVPLAEEITRWAPVLVPDLPGDGLSTGSKRTLSVPELAAALSEWMKLAGATNAHILGISFGCQVAAELAARFPHQLYSLTLLGPTIDPAAHDLQHQLARLAADVPREPVALWTSRLRGGMAQGMATIRARLWDRIESKLPRAEAPALVLRGNADPIAPESWVRKVAALLPEADSQTLPAGAHCVHFSHPTLVSSALRSFTTPLSARISQRGE